MKNWWQGKEKNGGKASTTGRHPSLLKIRKKCKKKEKHWWLLNDKSVLQKKRKKNFKKRALIIMRLMAEGAETLKWIENNSARN